MNTNKNIQIEHSPYRRITSSGCDIQVKNHSTRFVINLMRGNEKLATGTIPRGGGSSEAAMLKIKLNQFGPSACAYKLVAELAKVAEAPS